MQALIDVILPVFLVIGFGYVSTWRNLFPVTGIDGVMRFAQNFAIPCLLFHAIAKIDIAATFDPGVFAAFYTGAFTCFCLGVAGAFFIFSRPIEDCIVIGFCCLFSNSVLLGLPITERAYGSEVLGTNYALIAVHAPFCYLLGIITMELALARGQSLDVALLKVWRSVTHNGLFIGIFLGFVWNFSGLPLPQIAEDALSLISRAALPAALFALGGVLYQYRPEGDMLTIAMVCSIALLVHPIITYTMGAALQLPDTTFKPAVLTAAMAPGFNAYIFANMYGYAKRVAASSVLIATAMSILTAWAWLTILG
ncbi:MAG: AEC family transporter [Pseudomonadota bacterium]